MYQAIRGTDWGNESRHRNTPAWRGAPLLLPDNTRLQRVTKYSSRESPNRNWRSVQDHAPYWGWKPERTRMGSRRPLPAGASDLRRLHWAAVMPEPSRTCEVAHVWPGYLFSGEGGVSSPSGGTEGATQGWLSPYLEDHGSPIALSQYYLPSFMEERSGHLRGSLKPRPPFMKLLRGIRLCLFGISALGTPSERWVHWPNGWPSCHRERPYYCEATPCRRIRGPPKALMANIWILMVHAVVTKLARL